MDADIPDEQLARFSEFVANATGLNFPPTHWPDLKRGIVAAAISLGFDDAAKCARWLMSRPLSKEQLDVLIGHLTVGETYFFRDNRSFEVLAGQILPALMRARKDEGRRLRIWSAACCTGEEPYSIAIALRRAIPDWEQWNITLLATDINPAFLRKAEAGLYGQWSFRDTSPWLKDHYFQATADGQFQILPDIKRMVRFLQLNLVEDVYPSLFNDINAMDIIFCRNVLMYFTPLQAQKVIQRLWRSQANGGWLLVNPSEFPCIVPTPYTQVNLQDSLFYRKESGAPFRPNDAHPASEVLPIMAKRETGQAVAATPETPATAPLVRPKSVAPDRLLEKAKSTPDRSVESLTQSRRDDYEKAINKAEEVPPAKSAAPAAIGLLAHSLADKGQLNDALKCCDQWIAMDKLNLGSHYLRAMIHIEQGAPSDAIHSLRNALYIDPKFVLAHFAMGNIARQNGDASAAQKHLKLALQLLSDYQPEDVLPESQGVTAEKFAEIIRSLMDMEAAV